MNQPRILITGSTGNTGREVLKGLLDLGYSESSILCAVRNPGAGDTAANIRTFNFLEQETWVPALAGVEKLFLLRPPRISNIRRDMYPFLGFLADRGIRQVVFLSVQGSEKNSLVPHRKIEDAIRELDIPHTFLRPSFFMQNLTTTHLDEIREEKRLFLPAGEGRTNFIDVRDIGEASARVLIGEEHINKEYTITGERDYSYREVAELLSKELGETIRYEHANPFTFIRYHKRKGKSLSHALVMLVLYSAARFGKAAGKTDTLEHLLRRKPRSLEEFIRDHRELLLPRR